MTVKNKEIVVICGYCDKETTYVGTYDGSEIYRCKNCGTIWDLDKEKQEFIDVSHVLNDIKKKQMAG